MGGWSAVFLKYVQCDVDHDIINHHKCTKLQNEKPSSMEDFKYLFKKEKKKQPAAHYA